MKTRWELEQYFPYLNYYRKQFFAMGKQMKEIVGWCSTQTRKWLMKKGPFWWESVNFAITGLWKKRRKRSHSSCQVILFTWFPIHSIMQRMGLLFFLSLCVCAIVKPKLKIEKNEIWFWIWKLITGHFTLHETSNLFIRIHWRVKQGKKKVSFLGVSISFLFRW